MAHRSAKPGRIDPIWAGRQGFALFSFTSIFGALYATAIVAGGLAFIFWGLYDPQGRNPLVWGLGALFLWYGYTQWKNILRWWRAVPVARLSLSETGIALPNGRFRYDDVEHVGLVYVVTQKRQNFMKAGEDHNVLVTLVLGGGQKIEIVAGQGPTTWFGPTLGKNAATNLLDKAREIQRRTIANRAGKLMDALRQKQYFYYDSKKIAADGSVNFPDSVVPLSLFWLDTTSPFELQSRVKDGQFHKGAKLRSLSLAEDRDAFLAVVDQAFGIHWPPDGGWPQRSQRRSS